MSQAHVVLSSLWHTAHGLLCFRQTSRLINTKPNSLQFTCKRAMCAGLIYISMVLSSHEQATSFVDKWHVNIQGCHIIYHGVYRPIMHCMLFTAARSSMMTLASVYGICISLSTLASVINAQRWYVITSTNYQHGTTHEMIHCCLSWILYRH